MARVEDKVAMITGDTLGIGKAHAEALAREGAKILIAPPRRSHWPEDGLRAYEKRV